MITIISIALSIYVIITFICYELMRRELVDIINDESLWLMETWKVRLLIALLWPITFRNVRVGFKRK